MLFYYAKCRGRDIVSFVLDSLNLQYKLLILLVDRFELSKHCQKCATAWCCHNTTLKPSFPHREFYLRSQQQSRKRIMILVECSTPGSPICSHWVGSCHTCLSLCVSKMTAYQCGIPRFKSCYNYLLHRYSRLFSKVRITRNAKGLSHVLAWLWPAGHLRNFPCPRSSTFYHKMSPFNHILSSPFRDLIAIYPACAVAYNMSQVWVHKAFTEPRKPSEIPALLVSHWLFKTWHQRLANTSRLFHTNYF